MSCQQGADARALHADAFAVDDHDRRPPECQRLVQVSRDPGRDFASGDSMQIEGGIESVEDLVIARFEVGIGWRIGGRRRTG